VRVTTGSYYNNIYGDNNKLSQALFDVNKQISSGQKIQYAHEAPETFIDTVRLDSEITTLTQAKNSAQSAYKFTTQSDTIIGDIIKTIESMKVKMVSAANDAHSDTSIQAIAKELRGLQNHLMTLANTSIGGQYLFSGTATSQKPIAADGTYQGNDQSINAFLGSDIKQKYNITGAQLFSGQESNINRTITTNVKQLSLTDLYPDIMKDPNIPRETATQTYINGSSTIRDLMGDTDADPTNDTWQAHFYVQGTKTDGTSFKKQIDLNTANTVDDLMQKIAVAYGSDLVNVNINPNGQIEIQDRKSGSSKLDFHMVGAMDLDPAGADAANVTNIDVLQAGTTDFQNVIDFANPPVPPNPNANALYIKEFTKSGFTTPAGVPNTIEGINYDRTNFTQTGAKLASNISQIVKSDNSYAVPSTKLVDVAGTANLTGTQLNIKGTNITGQPIDLQINLGSPSSVSGTVNAVAIPAFDIFDATGVATNANSVTYQQLLDVVNMAMTNTLPAANTSAAYTTSLTNSAASGSTTLDYAGRMVFQDKTAPITSATMSLSDNASSDYTGAVVGMQGAILDFNANSAITIRDPKKDFFAEIEETIRAVEEGKKRADGSDTTDPRNLGIQNAIQKLDDLADHASRMQTEAGTYSQVMQASSDRTDLLIVSTKRLQSDVIDTDIAEATLKMQQLSLNYQALLSNISKVSKLSLVNYL